VIDQDRPARFDAVAAAFAAADDYKLDGWRAETDLWEVTVDQDGQALLDHRA
jgi:hypothetical protein